MGNDGEFGRVPDATKLPESKGSQDAIAKVKCEVEQWTFALDSYRPTPAASAAGSRTTRWNRVTATLSAKITSTFRQRAFRQCQGRQPAYRVFPLGTVIVTILPVSGSRIVSVMGQPPRS